MPHIAVKEFCEFATPAKWQGFTYLWFAKPLEMAKNILVGVQKEDQEFLLEIHRKKEKTLIKADKVTRPSPTMVAKEALIGFCELAKCQKLYDNLASIKHHLVEKSQSNLKSIEFFIESFPKDKKIAVEIGFGSGRHILYQAKKNPDTLFIGLEIHKPSIEQLLKQIALQKIENILVVDYDARLFLEFVPSNRLDKIFVHFPIPWDKKPHRRVIGKSFLKEAKRALKPGGVLELRTDSILYFEYSLDLFLQEQKAHLEIFKNIEAEVLSKYEARWQRLGKDIYEIHFKNLENSNPLKIGFDFLFEKEINIKKLSLKSFVFDDYFIHFQKLYQIPKGYLIELSFGSFDRPHHTYLIVEDNSGRYFAKKPVPSKANIKAHKKIEELLHG